MLKSQGLLCSLFQRGSKDQEWQIKQTLQYFKNNNRKVNMAGWLAGQSTVLVEEITKLKPALI